MKNENESVKELEVGKDYISKDGLIVIDRLGSYGNRGFDENNFYHDLFCSSPHVWREATRQEVIKALKKHLVHRYGEDWETMKIKKRHPSSSLDINDGSWDVDIYKDCDGWSVWNENGLLYFNGIWVERLEEVEELKIHIKEAIKEKTVVHCETEEEADHILGIAHALWTPSPEDIEAVNKKEIEKLPIDKVTIKNLDVALRMVGIQLDVNIIDKVVVVLWILNKNCLN